MRRSLYWEKKDTLKKEDPVRSTVKDLYAEDWSITAIIRRTIFRLSSSSWSWSPLSVGYLDVVSALFFLPSCFIYLTWTKYFRILESTRHDRQRGHQLYYTSVHYPELAVPRSGKDFRPLKIDSLVP